MQYEKIWYLLRWPHHWHIILHFSNHPHWVTGAVNQQPGSTAEVTGHLHADTLLLWASSWFFPDTMFLPPSREQIHMWVVLWTLCPSTAFAAISNADLSVLPHVKESCFGYLLVFCFIPCVCYHALKCSSSGFTNFIGQVVSVQGMILQYIVPYMPTHQFLHHTE
jgi:hypothetical protein